jgi:hypothetical protein
VLTADQKSDIYWIRFGGLLDCIRNRAHAAAVLVYDNIATDEDVSMIGLGEEGENDHESFTNIPGSVLSVFLISDLLVGKHCKCLLKMHKEVPMID